MKKMICIIMLFMSMNVSAQSPVPVPVPILEVIKAGIVKVIRAMDLQVQRWQNETIWLQNAQKKIENELTKLKLEEIAGWVEHQRVLYAEYFEELKQVKGIIQDYRKVHDIIALQKKIVREYAIAFQLFRSDQHFTESEIAFMENVYGGIFAASVEQLDELFPVVKDVGLSMTDASRLAVVEKVDASLQQLYADLQQFNHRNKLVSLVRARSETDVNVTKQLYGLP